MKQLIIHEDPMQVGALSRVLNMRRSLQVGKKYIVGGKRMTLVKKYSRYGLFRVDGVLASYHTCFGWYALLSLIGRD